LTVLGWMAQWLQHLLGIIASFNSREFFFCFFSIFVQDFITTHARATWLQGPSEIYVDDPSLFGPTLLNSFSSLGLGLTAGDSGVKADILHLLAMRISKEGMESGNCHAGVLVSAS
jgi:hypothetical protein